MTTFRHLPEEVVVKILSYLPPCVLEVAAWTLSHPITDICIHLLQPTFKSRRDGSRLAEKFGPPDDPPFVPHVLDGLKSPELFEKMGLDPEDVLKLPDPPRIPDLHYLDLYGDFKWLEPLPALVAKDMGIPQPGGAICGSAYDDLISSAERAGVSLPLAFLKFIQDPTLQDRIPSRNGAYFSLSEGGLHKVLKGHDGDVGGYKITFLSDSQSIYTICLYLEPGKDGASCILLESDGCCGEYHDYESECPEEDNEEAKNLGLQLMDPCISFSFLGKEFEAFLATMYYNELLEWVVCSKTDAVPGLGEYVKREFAVSHRPRQ